LYTTQLYTTSTMEQIFTLKYENRHWGNNRHPSYKGSSGEGSDIKYNKDTYVPFLKRFLQERHISSVVDLGCGDFRCGPYIYGDTNVLYTGYDAYKGVVDYNATVFPRPKYTFMHSDFFNNKELIVSADLCIIKDVLQHWSLQHIYEFLDFLVESKKFHYILLCNCAYQTQDDTDIIDGKFRPLSSNFLPLRKYRPVKLYQYDTKEVSLIEIAK